MATLIRTTSGKEYLTSVTVLEVDEAIKKNPPFLGVLTDYGRVVRIAVRSIESYEYRE